MADNCSSSPNRQGESNAGQSQLSNAEVLQQQMQMAQMAAMGLSPFGFPQFYPYQQQFYPFGGASAHAGFWPGVLSPDYMMNLAAFQGLTGAPGGQMQSGAESFAEILSKMPQAPIDSNNKSSSAGDNGDPPVSTSTPMNGDRSYDSLTPNSCVSSKPDENGCGPLMISSRSASVASLNQPAAVGTAENCLNGSGSGNSIDDSELKTDGKISTEHWTKVESAAQPPNNFKSAVKSANGGGEKLKKIDTETICNGLTKTRNSSERNTPSASTNSPWINNSSASTGFPSTSGHSNSFLGSETVQMDASLLNASAMAWAALSANPFLFAGGGGLLPPSMASVQAAMASLQQGQQKNNSQAGGDKSNRKMSRSRVSDSTSTQLSGRSSVATADGETSGRSSKDFSKNSVDLTIDDVISKSQHDNNSRRGSRGGRGRGTGVGRNVPNVSGLSASLPLTRGRGRGRGRGRVSATCSTAAGRLLPLGLRKPSDDISDVIGDLSALASVPESFSLSNGCVNGNTQEVALDLSKKGRSEGESHSDASVDNNGCSSSSALFGGTPVNLSNSKRPHSPDQSTSQPRKRRVADEAMCKLPLLHGWRRQTCVRSISASGVRGDVIYYAPCGKRLGSYAEVLRYLAKYLVEEVTRENFSFSSRLIVGEFVQVKPDAGDNGIVKMSEAEVRQMVENLQSGAFGQPLGHQSDSPVDSDVSVAGDVDGDDVDELGRRRRGRKPNVEVELAEQMRMQAAKDIVSSNDNNGTSATTNQSKSLWWAKRLERERTTQSNFEDKRRKLEELKAQKVLEGLKKTKDKEVRRQQMVMIKRQEEQYMRQMMMAFDLEREKQRQQFMMLRAIEARKRQEERQRLYAEKLIRREERMAAKHAHIVRMRLLRQPIDDLELEEAKPLPDLERISGLNLSGEAFSNALMTIEFLHNFAHVLKLDKSQLPSLEKLQRGLLNERKFVSTLTDLTKLLLTLVLEYPGLPAGQQGKTFLGQVVRDMTVSDENLNELLRMFLASRDSEGKRLSEQLEKNVFEALNPTTKAEILAFMCNELLYCRNVVREIETNIDETARLKGEKWNVDGKVRQMRQDPSGRSPGQNKGESSGRGRRRNSSSSSENDDSDADINTAESTTDKTRSNVTSSEDSQQQQPQGSSSETPVEAEGLGKESAALRLKISEKAGRVRSLPLGHDRFHRTYWVLPHVGGVLVEGMESWAPHSHCCSKTEKFLQMANSQDDIQSEVYLDVRECLNAMLDIVECTQVVKKEETDRGYADENSLHIATRSSPQESAVSLVNNNATVHAYAASHHESIHRHREKKSIPKEMSYGWWLISKSEDLESLQQSLMCRGIRERNLLRLLTKHKDSAIRQLKSGALNLGDTVDESHPDLYHFGAKLPDEPGSFSDEINNLVLRKCFRQIRQLEQKVFQANIHTRMWKPQDSAVNVPDMGESGGSKDSDQKSKPKAKGISYQKLLTMAKERLSQLELNIERRYLNPPFHESNQLPASEAHSVSEHSVQSSSNKSSGPILCENSNDSALSGQSDLDRHSAKDIDDTSDGEEVISPALFKWRNGLNDVKTASQLQLCLEHLIAHIAWDKSIMKASCQICLGVEHDSQLLLCDGCDMGYHTYCFKPKMDTIPEGDWFCPSCMSKASDKPCCLLCRKQNGRIHVCTGCKRSFHQDCEGLVSSPKKKGKETPLLCHRCADESMANSTKKRGRRRSEQPPTPDNNIKLPPPVKKLKRSETYTAKTTMEAESVPTVHTGPLKWEDICSIMMAELDLHKDSWPFKLPVDTKVFPLYKKVIRKPIDLAAIQLKLKNHKYDDEESFTLDVQLIFDNCKTFNEDESPVGKAGHNLRKFFQKRWKELKGSQNFTGTSRKERNNPSPTASV